MHDKLQQSVYNFRFYKIMPNLGNSLSRATNRLEETVEYPLGPI
jgi:hypothetical protein